MNRPLVGGGIALTALALLLTSILQAGAVAPSNEHFQRTWARTDQPVASGQVSRTWMWAPDAFTGALQEPYSDAPGGMRTVQYFDKARMEITNPDGDPNSVWYVTNGLLVVELISGRLQAGDTKFLQRQPAAVNVAGDADDPSGPMYASFTSLLNTAPAAAGSILTKRVSRGGQVTEDAGLTNLNVVVALIDEVTNHAIAEPFWQFMTSNGTIWDGATYITAPLFENPFFATGRPITEAYWANVKVGGTYQDVLMQCFERRCLTYTPGNAPGWQVEAGNVGQHYYAWRYQQPATRYTFDFAFGEPYEPTDRLNYPWGVGIDPSGRVWITDTVNDRMVAFDADGRYVTSFGTKGNAPGQVDFPSDIAFDSTGAAYVADDRNGRIQKFSPAGAFIKEWGGPGSGDGKFSGVKCIEVHADVVYACDAGHSRIQRFNTDGAYLGQWGTKGAGPGQFDYPHGIAFDADGNVYVADSGNHRIQKFDPTFAYLTEFGTDAGSSVLQTPFDVAVDQDFNVYATSGYDRIVVFEPDGSYLRSIGQPGTGLGYLSSLVSIALDPDGNLYAVDDDPAQVQKFAPDGTPLWRITNGTRFRFATPVDIAITAAGDVIVSDQVGDFGRVAYWSLDGEPGVDITYIDYVNLPPRYDPTGVAIAPGGDVYVADISTDNIWHFAADRRLIDHWGESGSAFGKFSLPGGIAVDADGDVYVVDSGNHWVQKFTSTGVLLDVWGETGSGDGQFSAPVDIAIFGERVYVTDTGNYRVQVFDREGTYLDQWGTAGGGPGEFRYPVGIAVDAGGYVYVVDRLLNRIQKFTPEGEHLATFGLGGEQGLDNPFGIAVAPDGRVYVADSGNQRVVVFRPDD